MRTITETIYKITELSPEAKQTAHNNWHDIPFEDDVIKDDIIEIADCLGINIERLMYSGFYCQGDGACFIGSYEYNPNWKDTLESHAPCAETMFTLGNELEKVYNKYGSLHVTVTHNNSNYYHENSVDINCEYDCEDDAEDEIRFKALEEISYLLRDFMKQSYKLIRDDYDYQCSEESFIQFSLDNDLEYYEDGEQYF